MMTSYFAGIVDFIGLHPHYALTAIFMLACCGIRTPPGRMPPRLRKSGGSIKLASGSHSKAAMNLKAAAL
jgi:hypothetical protein